MLFGLLFLPARMGGLPPLAAGIEGVVVSDRLHSSVATQQEFAVSVFERKFSTEVE
jgi:hypothetical protein